MQLNSWTNQEIKKQDLLKKQTNKKKQIIFISISLKKIKIFQYLLRIYYIKFIN